MPDHIIRFDTYDLDQFSVVSMSGASRLPDAEIPRRDGIAIGAPSLEKRMINLEGVVWANDLRTARGALLAALNAGRKQLWIWDDRYIWATKTGFDEDYEPAMFPHLFKCGIEFTCDDPFFYSGGSASTDTWDSPVSGTSRNITIGGEVYVEPVYKLTVSGSGVLDVTLAAGGLSLNLNGTVANLDVLVIDCAALTVTLQSSGADKMSLFDLDFLPLAAGVNALTYTKNSGTPTISSIVTEWRNRWY